MGDVGDYWREAKAFRKNVQPGQYKCECGCHVWKRKKECSFCHRANPHPATKRSRAPGAKAAVAALFLALAATPALAQTQATGVAQSGSTAYAIAGGGGSGPMEGGYSLRTTPHIAQSFALGQCVTGAQVGVSGMGFGFGVGGGVEDPACTRRNNAAALFALGMADEARALMGQDADVQRAIAEVAARRVAPQPVRTTTAPPDGVLRFASTTVRPQPMRACRWVGRECR